MVYGATAQLVPPPTATQEEQEPDTTQEQKPDSLRMRFYPRSIRFGTDLISLIKSQTTSTFTGWEVNADIDCGKYFMAVDYGSWGRNYDLRNGGDYTNSGTYWRAGMDANLLRKDPDKNLVFLGFRYGHSSFSESSNIHISDPFFGDVQKHVTNPAVTAAWGELTGGLRVKIWKEFWMGYTARMKFAPTVTGETGMTTYDIPGYGRNVKGFYWGFNYQIFWRIPFTKQKKAAPKPPPKSEF